MDHDKLDLDDLEARPRDLNGSEASEITGGFTKTAGKTTTTTSKTSTTSMTKPTLAISKTSFPTSG